MKIYFDKRLKDPTYYGQQGFRNGKKVTSKNIMNFGKHSELLKITDDPEAYVREEIRKWNEEYRSGRVEYSLPADFNQRVPRTDAPASSSTWRNIGYFFLQDLMKGLRLKDFFRQKTEDRKITFDCYTISRFLTYARILDPLSKHATWHKLDTYYEQPDFDYQHILRFMDLLEEHYDDYLAWLFKQSNAIVQRDTSVLYYDCTNFFFEIEEEKGLRKYGKSKEHRPNPIVNMGLFLDGDGIPLAFTIFSGNGNEQPTLIPLEKKILNDFRLSKFIICTDAGLASNANRKFNSRQDRSYVVTQPLKKLKEHIRKWALDTKGFHLDNSSTEYDISDIDEHLHKDSVFFKERWVNEDGIEQRLIVSYCPKHRMYQREVRNRQIERAEKIIEGGKRKCRRNQNSPERFIEQLQVTSDGQIAETTLMQLNGDRILQEEQYDGFYAVCTNLEGDVNDIIRINRRRWEIEDSFRLMKSEFQARPVYLQNDARIRAHFMTCFISLTLFRILEKRLGGRYTASEIITALRSMKFQRIQGVGYIPCYTRTAVTDSLHEAFGFRTDREIITMQNMKKILRETKR